MGVGPLFVKFLLFILAKIVLNENNVEFDFRIGHALVLSIFLNNEQKVNEGSPPSPPKCIYIDIFWTYKIIFTKSHNDYLEVL